MSLFDFHSYPALKVSALMIVGILIGDSLGLPVFLTGIATGCIFVLSLILAIVSHRIDRSSAWDTVALLLLCVLIGATKIGLDRSSSSITDDLFERPVTVTGKIVEPPARFDNRIRFLFRSNSLVADSMIVPFRFNILVTIKQTRGDTSTENLTYGRQLRVKGQISRPPEERNPGEFNARQYYEANGIPFFMFVRNPVHLAEVEVPEPSWSPMEWIMRETVVPVRLYIQSHIDGTIGGEEGEFLKGILIGDRTGISVATRQAFVNSGVAHILAVSGSNVAVLVVIFFFLFEMLRFPKQIKIVFTVVALWFYVLLTGSQPPVVRATVMATVFLIGLMVEHKSNAYNSLGLSALIILAFDARQVFDVGFQLSFVAVLSIIYLYPRANDWIRRIPARSLLHRLAIRVLQVCAVSAVATLGTLPFTALYFGRVSVVGVLTNIIVIPAAGLSIVLGFVSSVAGLLSSWLEQVYASANHFILYWTMIVARVSGGLSVAYVDTLQFTVIDSIPYYAFLAFALHFNMKQFARSMFIVFLIGLNLVVYIPLPPVYEKVSDRMRVSFIDVGQGDAILIEMPEGRNIVIDAGSRFSEYDAGERIVAPFLKRRRITTIDLLIVSHPHNDHIGGVPHLFGEFEIEKVIDGGQPVRSGIYREYLQRVGEEGSIYESTTAGRIIDAFRNVRLYVIYPTQTYIDTDTTRTHQNLNNTSVVIKLRYGEVSFLCAGDAEQEAEDEMVDLYGEFLQSTLLKVGHHGSTTSTTKGFLASVKPEYAVVSVGRNNKFQHPSPVVLQRLKEMNVDVARTDEEGAIVFETDGVTLSRVDWR